jgi:hypothetical protein
MGETYGKLKLFKDPLNWHELQFKKIQLSARAVRVPSVLLFS